MSVTQFVGADAAAAMINDGDTVAIAGNGAGMISAEAIFAAVEQRFLATGSPRDLTLVHSLGLGDRENLGTNRFAHEGLVRKVIAAHFTWSTKMQELIRDEKVEAYCLPGGVIQHLLREIGAGRPGLFTHSGLGTFVDPRQDGGLTAGLPDKLERRIIARRAALELGRGMSLNFGFGMPGGIFGVIAEQGIADDLWMSVEQGVHNGRMLDDRLFGAARNPDAVVPSVEQFDYYSGGGIDATFLGMGEMDGNGDVNVSHLGGNLVGPGGFIEIAQNAKKVVFCGTFDAQGGKISWQDGALRIDRPGRTKKLVKRVARITFAADYARRRGQEVLYVTERAVFRLDPQGIRLVEVAPGIDIARDLLPQMEFQPVITDWTTMSATCFG